MDKQENDGIKGREIDVREELYREQKHESNKKLKM